MRTNTEIKKNLNSKDKQYFELYIKEGSFRSAVVEKVFQLLVIAKTKKDYSLAEACQTFLSNN